MADDQVTQDFAAMMSEARAQAESDKPPHWLNADGSPKYGTHPDGSPKKAAGRPRTPPSLEELKADREETGASSPAGEAPADRAPDPGKHKRGKRDRPPVDVPQHRPGLITRGMNKRYRQVGKAVRALDKKIGQGFIEAARNTADPPAEGQEPEDNSVGAAWDDVARTNPRIRKFCLALIQGGALGALVLAHAPIGIAVAMKFVSEKPGFFGKLILSMAEPDDDTAEGEGGLPYGMTAADMAQLASMADRLMPGMVPPQEPAAAASPPRPPSPFAHNGSGSRRNQPKGTTRAARRTG